MHRLVIVAALCLTANARADDRIPITGMLGVGLTTFGDTGYGGATHVAAIDATLAYEISRHVALGARVAIATPTSFVGGADYGNLPGDYQQTTYSVIPFDLGVTAVFSRPWVWIAPWLGEHFSHSTGTTNDIGAMPPITTADFVMLGLSVGVDVLRDGDDKLSLYIDLDHSVGSPHNTYVTNDSNPEFAAWAAFTVGVAYRR